MYENTDDLYDRIKAENAKQKQAGWENSVIRLIELPNGECKFQQTEGCGQCKHFSDYVHPYERLCGPPTMALKMHECLKHHFRTWENCSCQDYEKKPDNVEVVVPESDADCGPTKLWALLLIGMIVIAIVIACLF